MIFKRFMLKDKVFVKVESGSTIEIPMSSTFQRKMDKRAYDITFEDHLANYFTDTDYRVKKIKHDSNRFTIELYQKLDADEAFDLCNNIFKPLYTLNKKDYIEWFKERLNIRLDKVMCRLPKGFDYKGYRSHHEEKAIEYMLEDLPHLRHIARDIDDLEFGYFKTVFRCDDIVCYQVESRTGKGLICLDLDILEEHDAIEDYFPVIEDYLREKFKDDNVDVSMHNNDMMIVSFGIDIYKVKDKLVSYFNDFLAIDKGEMMERASDDLSKAIISGYLDKAKEIVKILLDEMEHPIYAA